MNRLKKLWTPVGLVAVLALAVGCGSSKDDAGSPPTASGGASGSAAPLTAVEKVSTYSGADRNTYLYDCAKKEGTLTYYTSNSAAKTLIAPAFEVKYPGIKVNVYTAGNDLVQRLQEEEDAGKHTFDVLGDIYGNIARTSKYFARYSSPDENNVKPELKSPYYVATNGFVMTAAYNTKIISAADAPKSYADLADPKWKGKIVGGFDASTPITYKVVKDAIGDDLMNKLASNVSVTEGQGSRAVADLMEAGTFPIAWGVSDTYQKTDGPLGKNLPFQMIPLEPMVAFFAINSVSAKSPHPCSAALFVDWLIDQKPGGGAEAWRKKGDALPFAGTPLVPFETGSDPATWKIVQSSDPSIVKGFNSYAEAAAKYTTDFRNQFIRK